MQPDHGGNLRLQLRLHPVSDHRRSPTQPNHSSNTSKRQGSILDKSKSSDFQLDHHKKANPAEEDLHDPRSVPLRADLHKLLAWLQPESIASFGLGVGYFPLLIGSVRNLCTTRI
ncbi:hypothetical protein AFLA_005164 [Aspergillus flavus NRRL3357]|nr:hypothetical protein AFLA_005164 [Aspergillus flavus NRRL3357]